MRNPLKRTDVFRCRQGAHARFGGAVSANHVLREKKCFPEGCLYFLWRCVRLEKGLKCPQRFKVPGRKCGGCTHYHEDKMHFQPELLLDASGYEAFREELEAFEAWLGRASRAPRSVAGRITAVKPRFERTVPAGGGAGRTSLRGYLLVMKRGFVEKDAWDDTLYVRVPSGLNRRHLFVPKMRVELTGEIREDRGRLVVAHPRAVEVLNRGWGRPWTDEEALVAVRTAVRFDEQREACLSCPWGALADVTDRSEAEEVRYRELYCLKAVPHPDRCAEPALRALRKAQAGRT